VRLNIKLQETVCFEDLSIGSGILFKSIFEKQNWMAWTGFF